MSGHISLVNVSTLAVKPAYVPCSGSAHDSKACFVIIGPMEC